MLKIAYNAKNIKLVFPFWESQLSGGWGVEVMAYQYYSQH